MGGELLDAAVQCGTYGIKFPFMLQLTSENINTANFQHNCLLCKLLDEPQVTVFTIARLMSY